MDVNRRHLLGVSAAGAAGAFAMAPDAARAATLTSTLGRDVTQYGVRRGSPDDQTRTLQRAIDEAARAQVPLAGVATTVATRQSALRPVQQKTAHLQAVYLSPASDSNR